MHWTGYEILSIISGGIVVIFALLPRMDLSSRVWAGGTGIFFIGYGIYVASRDSGAFLFPSLIVMIPILAALYLLGTVVLRMSPGRDTTANAGVPSSPLLAGAPIAPVRTVAPMAFSHSTEGLSAGDTRGVGTGDRHCPGCGRPFGAGARFCGACGSPVADGPPFNQPPVEPPVAEARPRAEHDTESAREKAEDW